jgi:hypothetical protein
MDRASADDVRKALEELASRAGLIGDPPDEQLPTGGSLF